MKTKSFLLILLSSILWTLSFTSCREDKYWDEVTPSQKEETLQVGIPFLRQPLRTSPADPATKVESVFFAFFNGNDSRSSIVKVLDSSNPEEISKGQFLLKLPKGEYYLLVVANPNAKMKELLVEGTPLEQLTVPKHKEYFHSKNFYSGTKKLKDLFPIALLNAQGLVPVTEAHFGDTPVASLKVELELSFARLIVNGYPTFHSSIKDLLGKYTLFATRQGKESFPMRQMALLSSGTQEQLGDGSTASDRYAYSPYYKEIEAATTQEALLPFLQSSAFYKSATPIPSEENWLSTDTPLEEKRSIPSAYRLELTVSHKNLLTALTPHLALVYRLCPTSLSPAEGEGWISYQQHYYLLESDFKKVLLALKQGTAVDPEIVKDLPDSFLVASKKLLEEAQNDPETLLLRGFTKEDIRFYKKSYNYYFFPIRHFTDTEAPQLTSYGRYGLVRGNDYIFRAPSEIKEFGSTSEAEILNDFSPLRENEHANLLISVGAIHPRSEQELTY